MSGAQTYPPLTRCVCGELSSVHVPDSNGVRKACSYSNCKDNCKKFTEEVDDRA